MLGVFVLLFLCFAISHAGFERTPQPPAVYGDGVSALFSGDADPLSVESICCRFFEVILLFVFLFAFSV